MRRLTLACTTLLICGSFLPASAISAAGKKAAAKTDPAVPAVDKVLRAEVAGEVDRRGKLAVTLEQHPNSTAARWQAGYVQNGNRWRSFDEIMASPAESYVLDEYRARRQETAQTPEGQLQLAEWCRKHGLLDAERAHLCVSVALAPAQSDAAVLERIGYRRIGAQWLSAEQLVDWQRINHRSEVSLNKWATKLERIVERLSGPKERRAAALTDLRHITDGSAVPAIEFVVAGRDQETAILAVDVLRGIDGYEASLALARQGVFSQWPEVRRRAAEALKGRRLEDFVPALINLLALPAAGQFRFYHDASRGILAYSYILAIETDNQFQVSTLTITNQVIVNQTNVITGFRFNSPQLRESQANARLAAQGALATADENAMRSLADRLYGREQELEAANERMRELNERVIGVLAGVSGKDATPDARQWWQWWNDQMDSQYYDPKPVVNYVDEIEATATPIALLMPIGRDCFLAGTPVRTDRGMLPIEKIQVGDRVLAQDIETGELAYKPVLRTTIRAPRALFTLRSGDEAIVCTGGHRFWSSGSGWVKVRDLEPQALLHTATGNVPVWTSRKGEPARTYNLVVADFHTFFVGTTGLLSQDVLLPKSTDNPVPGLSRERAVAQVNK